MAHNCKSGFDSAWQINSNQFEYVSHHYSPASAAAAAAAAASVEWITVPATAVASRGSPGPQQTVHLGAAQTRLKWRLVGRSREC